MSVWVGENMLSFEKAVGSMMVLGVQDKME